MACIGSEAGLEADEAEVGVAVLVWAKQVLAARLMLHQRMTFDARPYRVHLHDLFVFICESLHSREKGV